MEKEKVDSFNIPVYLPSPWELKAEVLKEGSFTINYFEVSKINRNNYDIKSNDFTKCVQSVIEPLFIHHFGEAIIEELFDRYRKVVDDFLSKEDIEFSNLTISLTKVK